MQTAGDDVNGCTPSNAAAIGRVNDPLTSIALGLWYRSGRLAYGGRVGGLFYVRMQLRRCRRLLRRRRIAGLAFQIFGRMRAGPVFLIWPLIFGLAC